MSARVQVGMKSFFSRFQPRRPSLAAQQKLAMPMDSCSQAIHKKRVANVSGIGRICMYLHLPSAETWPTGWQML